MSEIKPDEVQRLAKCLAEMPDAESPLTKRKTVALLASAIQQARDKGYTLKHIARQLQRLYIRLCKCSFLGKQRH